MANNFCFYLHFFQIIISNINKNININIIYDSNISGILNNTKSFFFIFHKYKLIKKSGFPDLNQGPLDFHVTSTVKCSSNRAKVGLNILIKFKIINDKYYTQKEFQG